MVSPQEYKVLMHLESACRGNNVALAANIVAMIYDGVDRELEEIPRNFRVKDGCNLTIPCQSGCYYCCSLPVVVTEQEAIGIFSFVVQMSGERWSERLQAVKNLGERARAARTQIGQAQDDERRRLSIACPLLLDGRCSVYRARPLACRTYLAIDVAACRKTYEEPELEMDIATVRQGMELAGLAGQKLLEFSDVLRLPFGRSSFYDLIEALDVLFNMNEAEVIAFAEGRAQSPLHGYRSQILTRP